MPEPLRSAGRAPAAPPRRAGVSLLERALADGLVVAVLAGWWAMARTLPPFVMPGPVAVLTRLGQLFVDPNFLGHTVVSTLRVVSAVGIALLLGGALALLPHRWPVLRGIVHRRIEPVLNSFPSVGWAILAVIWFNVSDFSVIFVETAILLPFCLVNISAGLRELDGELLEMGRSFGRAPGRILWKIVLPQLVPYIVAALRISYGVGWKIALVAELFGAERGLGYLMLQAETAADAALVFATCLAIVAIFFLGERLVLDPLARRLVRH